MSNAKNLLVKGRLVCGAVVAPILLLWASFAFGGDASPWGFLPSRVLDIEGGSVAFQSAVIVDTQRRLTNPLLQDYPLHYILPVTNESDFPIWVEVEWHVPNEKPFASSGQLAPKEFGVFFVKTKQVVWNTPIPVTTAIYADKAKSRKLGGREVILLFREDAQEKEAFLQSAEKLNSITEKMAIAQGSKKAWLPILPGFQEMVDMSKPVAGSAADKKLSEDVRLLLWKNQSRRYWDCSHEVLGARQYDSGEVPKLESVPEKDRALIEAGRARGDIAFEEWRIKSCETVSTYLVLMGKSPKGGTDLVATKIAENGSP